MTISIKNGLIGLVTLFGVYTQANAAPTVYFGENLAPAGTVSGSPLTASNAFLSALTGVGREDFETQTLDATSPLTVNFVGSTGSITGALSGDGVVADATTDSGAGRFNTTAGGSKWWLASNVFSIDFISPISAFGFFGTDVGDFDGQLSLTLLDTSDHETTLTVGNTTNRSNGSLLFWGFIDPLVAYTKITFGNTGTDNDGFGIDDLVIGERQQPNVVPEPTSLALVGLSLAGLAAWRRRQQ